MKEVTISGRIQSLEEIYGGLRPLARAIGIDVGYIKRLRDGDKSNPSECVLSRLGLEKRVMYVLK